jgi:threonine synthase
MGTVIGAAICHPDGKIDDVIGDVPLVASLAGDLIEYRYAYSPDLLPPPIAPPTASGMWRYVDLLPLATGPIRFPLPVGGTPLIAPPRLRSVAGLPLLWLKDETRSPTGSNKDRATALVLEQALRSNVETVTAASTGNVAVSLAVGAAAAGLRAVIFVPDNVGEGKLRFMLMAGATVFRVSGGYEAAFRLSRAAAREFGWLDRNTGANPFTVEAKKTAAFEIWEQLGNSVPHAVVVPVGDGTSFSAVFKGFRELVACGVAERVPRMIGVQATGCRPLVCAWKREGPAPGAPAGTIAEGIAVDAPVNGVTALRDARASGGGFVAVSDDAILRAIKTMASAAGVLAEPAAAAGFAGLRPALSAGLITSRDTVVVYVTGTGLKTPQYLAPDDAAFTVKGEVREVRAALSAATDAIEC